LTDKVIATVPMGQAPQAIVHVLNAVPEGDGTQNTQAPGLAGESAHLGMMPVGASQTTDPAPTNVALFGQGLLRASAIGLQLKSPYLPGLSDNAADRRRYLVIAPPVSGKPRIPDQVQALKAFSFCSKQKLCSCRSRCSGNVFLLVLPCLLKC
jgi:hypothetical protein